MRANKGILRLISVAFLLVIQNIALAVVNHSGVLVSDEVWDNVDTHLVTGDVTVPVGITLTISQGAIVNFETSDDQSSGIDAARTELIVSGNLQISGVLGSVVTLTSNAALVNAAGDWYGIRVINGGSLTVRYAVIDYAVTGIDYRVTSAVLVAPLIEDSVIQNTSVNGIYLESKGGAQVSPSIQRNTINAIGSRGVYVWTQDSGTTVTSEVSGNTISNTGLNGIYNYVVNSAREAGNYTSNIVHTTGTGTTNANDQIAYRVYTSGGASNTSNYRISKNQIYNSAGTGLEVFANYGSTVLDFRENIVRDNAQYGAYLRGMYYGFTVTVVGNQFYNNGNAGLLVVDENTTYPSLLNSVVMLNESRNNVAQGFFLRSARPLSVVYNSVHDNGGEGMLLDVVGPSQINFNNLYTNSTVALDGMQVRNNRAGTVDASYNWWDTVSTDEMNLGGNPKNISGIFDIYDDLTKGNVKYANWFTAIQTEPLSTAPQSWIKTPVDGSEFKASTYIISGSASSIDPIDRVEVSTDGGVTWFVAT
ncbi:hypothetical protein MNBD_GAMMA22-1209, partial [hydrothermal vent metagenome]